MRELPFERHHRQAGDHQEKEASRVNVVGDFYFGPEPGGKPVGQFVGEGFIEAGREDGFFRLRPPGGGDPGGAQVGKQEGAEDNAEDAGSGQRIQQVHDEYYESGIAAAFADSGAAHIIEDEDGYARKRLTIHGQKYDGQERHDSADAISLRAQIVDVGSVVNGWPEQTLEPSVAALGGL